MPSMRVVYNSSTDAFSRRHPALAIAPALNAITSALDTRRIVIGAVERGPCRSDGAGKRRMREVDSKRYSGSVPVATGGRAVEGSLSRSNSCTKNFVNSRRAHWRVMLHPDHLHR